jgi:homeobox protein cut-like
MQAYSCFQEQLRAELEATRSGTDTETSHKIKALEATIDGLEQSRDQLSRIIEKQKAQQSDSDREHSVRVAELNAELTAKNSEIDSLKKKLAKFSDYDEIKRELEIMKVRASG